MLLHEQRQHQFKPCCQEIHAKKKNKKNCRKNPLCVWGLAQKKSVVWGSFSSYLQSYECEEDRCPGRPGGIRNLGATCYLGSLLQLLYTSRSFRRAVCGNKSNGEVTRCLESVFADAAMGNRSSCDPSELVDMLGLDPAIQQDPHEFGKLFLQRLEMEGLDPCELFRGQVENSIECGTCGFVSKRKEDLDELEVPLVGKSVRESVDSLQKPELMNGDNLYHCERCRAKREAVRKSTVVAPPRTVAFVQLLRYVYDNGKKKLKTQIELSKTLTICGRVFELKAVVYHRGESANVGHYVASADRNGTWFDFDDEIVSIFSEKYKGEAYMLLYVVVGADDEGEPSSDIFSEEARQSAEELNERHIVDKASYEEQYEQLESKVKERSEACREMMAGTPTAEAAEDGQLCGQYFMLETSLVEAWVNGDDLIGAFRPTMPDLCEHKKIKDIRDFKCLKAAAYERIVADLSLTTRIRLSQNDIVCRECALKTLADREHAEMIVALRDDLRIALAEEVAESTKYEEDLFYVSTAFYKQLLKGKKSSATVDLECEHGKLSPVEPRFRVDQMVWRKLVHLFPASKEYRVSEPGCDLCATRHYAAQVASDEKKLQLREAPVLRDLLERRGVASTDGCRLIRRSWLARWRAYHRLSSPATQPPPSFRPLLCTHGLPRLPAFLWAAQASDEAIRAFALLKAEARALAIDDLVEAGYCCGEGEDQHDVVSEAEFAALRDAHGGAAPSCDDGYCEKCVEADTAALERNRTDFRDEGVNFVKRGAVGKRRQKSLAISCDSNDPIGLVLLKLLEAWKIPLEAGVAAVYDSGEARIDDNLEATLRELNVKASATLSVDLSNDSVWTLPVLAGHFAERRHERSEQKKNPEKGFQGTLLMGGNDGDDRAKEKSPESKAVENDLSLQEDDMVLRQLADMGYDIHDERIAIAIEEAQNAAKSPQDVLPEVIALLNTDDDWQSSTKKRRLEN